MYYSPSSIGIGAPRSPILMLLRWFQFVGTVGVRRSEREREGRKRGRAAAFMDICAIYDEAGSLLEVL